MNQTSLNRAFVQHQAGNLAEAARLYRDVLRADPKHFDALCMLGLLHCQRGEIDDAARVADSAMQCDPHTATAHYNLGCLLQNVGRHRAAIASFEKALAAKPQYFEAIVNRGACFMALEEARDALDCFDQALTMRPREAGLWNNRGNAQMWLGQNEEAVESYDRAVAIKPNYSEAWGSRGNALLGLGRSEDALASYDKALAFPPGSATHWTNRGIALYRLKRYADAIANFDAALAIDPRRAKALLHRGNALSMLKRHAEALASFDASLALAPDDPDTLVSRGAALTPLGRTSDALACYDRALALKPDCIEALVNRGTMLFGAKRYEAAVGDYERVLALDPDFAYIAGNLALYRLLKCDWSNLEESRRKIGASLLAGKPAVLPFVNLALSRSMMDQLQCARLWAKREVPPVEPMWHGERYRHDRIRVVYLSGDFQTHAVAFLIAGVFEHHDRTRFETIAVSYGDDDGSEMRTRLRKAFDRFIDTAGSSDFEIATLLRQMEADIVIDLKGHTEDGRPGILAYRPAPVQVQYLGYPGTMGMDCIDYVIADKIVVPENHRMYFSEKVAYLPDSYQCNDSRRRVAGTTPERAALGLPEDGFVFCSFNNSYKILPDVFAAWMRLLRQTEHSVLWLLDHGEDAKRNLARETAAGGVDPKRLVFAPFAANADHLARMRRADLFLDTFPYNAHTTASDALWVGLPVVTVLGNTFASRVAASLLNAAGLPELVTNSLAAYEALALKLATDPDVHAAIKAKLMQNRGTAPLFDTARTTRNLEALYTEMWARAQRGEQPESFTAAPEPVRA